jgi:hypothetical protein
MLARRDAVILASLFVFAGPFDSAFAQSLNQTSGIEIPWWRVISALIFCLLLAVGAALAIKVKLQGGEAINASFWRQPGQSLKLFDGGPRRLKLIETLRLSHQVDICLVKCGDGDFVVAATPHGAFIVHNSSPLVSPESA